MKPFSWDKPKRGMASQLVWATYSNEALPDTLTSDPAEDDAAVCNGEDSAGEARDHSPEKVGGFYTQATNWDALLDTAGAPTDGVPPDPLESKRLAEEMGIPSLEEMAKGKGPGAPAGGTPGITAPVPSLTPPVPQAQDRANERQRAGRGVEGTEVGPSNPMDNADPYDWDSLPVPGVPPVGY